MVAQNISFSVCARWTNLFPKNIIDSSTTHDRNPKIITIKQVLRLKQWNKAAETPETTKKPKTKQNHWLMNWNPLQLLRVNHEQVKLSIIQPNGSVIQANRNAFG